MGQAAGLAVAMKKPMEINKYHYGTEIFASTYSSYIVPNGSPLRVRLKKFIHGDSMVVRDWVGLILIWVFNSFTPAAPVLPNFYLPKQNIKDSEPTPKLGQSEPFSDHHTHF